MFSLFDETAKFQKQSDETEFSTCSKILDVLDIREEIHCGMTVKRGVDCVKAGVLNPRRFQPKPPRRPKSGPNGRNQGRSSF
ncbi:hypothetical protein CDAR_609071 [Caerostris darwini]|uniref:Uncharacterized protein n=1 Tax=Caerostris darwini TaxID=1538125 RepID=A0AAV4WJL5_9ARAC|nr:hypothetical protein CDAR_609071 [Caerostris darwini]